ncbi:MAG: flagellar protein FlbA, partial [Hyphomonadaceae bacterium]
ERWGVSLNRIPDLDVKEDLEGVAAAGAAQDIVIAPMNASSNLAAACGGATWFLYHRAAWTMLGAERSPFYPASRAFYAQGEENWSHVMQAVARALGEAAAARTAAA